MKQSTIKSAMQVITPERAHELLARNTSNRHLREKLVETYAQDMRSGHWLPNGQGISVAADGTLLDGQHRLTAVTRANVPVEMLIVSGLPKTSRNGLHIRTVDTIDVGAARGIADLLALGHGIDNANLTAAMVRTILDLAVNYQRKTTMPVTLRILQIYGSAMKEVIAKKGPFIRFLHNAAVLGAIAFAAQVDIPGAVEFEEALMTGEGLRKGDPCLNVRNFLLSGKVAYKKGVRSRLQSVAVLSAMMHRAEGSSVVRLKQSNAGLEYYRERQEQTIEKLHRILSVPEVESES